MLAALLPSVSRRATPRRSPAIPKRRWCSTTCIAATCSPIAGASATQPVYQFHALFREFLLAEGKRRLAPEERHAALDRAAGQLVARGDFDAAAALYLEAKAWPALVGLTLHAGTRRCSPRDGARRSLDWLAAMPAEIREAEPRLALGEAYAVMYDEPARCKALLERAFEGFVARNDVRRQLLTAAAAIDCHYFEWADFAPLDRWIDVLDAPARRRSPNSSPPPTRCACAARC